MAGTAFGGIAATVGLFIALNQWGYDVPRPVLSNELKSIAEEVDRKLIPIAEQTTKNSIAIAEGSIVTEEARWLQFEAEIQKYIRAGEEPPQILIMQRNAAQRRKDDIQRELNFLRNQKP